MTEVQIPLKQIQKIVLVCVCVGGGGGGGGGGASLILSPFARSLPPRLISVTSQG